MSKSLGNFFTLRDLLGRGHTGRQIRYLLLSAHYRETFNFTFEGLEAARASLLRLDQCLTKLREVAGGLEAAPAPGLVSQFEAMMDEDLNVSGAWGAVFEWVRQTNRRLDQNGVPAGEAAGALAAWERLDTVLGVGARVEAEVPAEVTALFEARQAARKAKEFARADTLRGQLKALGWAVEDTPKGARLKRG
jgi:cysteinyl-tRNA synthetase